MAWLTGWRYRKSITVSRASGAVTNYQLKLLLGESSGATGESVDCGGKCLSTFNDIRFTTSDGTTLLDYWIESLSGTTPNQLATIWIEFDSIGTSDTIFYMYYGSAGASSVSNGTNTFLYYDASNSKLLTSYYSGDIGLRLRATITPSNRYTQIYFRDSSSGRLIAQYDDTSANQTSWINTLDGSGYTYYSNLSLGYNAPHIYDLIRSGSSVYGFVDGSSAGSTSTYVPSGNLAAGFNYINNFTIDWRLVRKCSYTEPAWGSWGGEERSPSPISAKLLTPTGWQEVWVGRDGVKTLISGGWF
jgi:hypothetical protein